jgi:aspartate/methionine/tyrosine aminotransferase
MKYSNLVKRISGDGADAWETHYTASSALERGEDVIILSVGDPEVDTPQPVLERAIEALRSGDTHYTAVAGRELLREAIAAAHRGRTGQMTGADNVIFLAGAQNALFAASLCIAGPGDEVIAFEPLYPTYPATIEVTGARMVRVAAPASGGFRPDLRALEAAINAQTRAIFSERRHHRRRGHDRHRRAGPASLLVGGGRRGVRGTRARGQGTEPRCVVA